MTMTNGYRFYLGDLQLPVAPSKIAINIKNQNRILHLINNGEINVLKQAGLTEVGFSALIPDGIYPFASYPTGFKRAQYFLDKIEDLKAAVKPFYFRVIRGDGKPETSLLVALEEYTIEEEAENGMDYIVSIKLKQFKAYGTAILNFNLSTGKLEKQVQRPKTFAAPEIYTIKAGDSLYKIAKAVYGDPARQYDLYHANREILDAEAKKHGKQNVPGSVYLYVGTKIKIGR